MVDPARGRLTSAAATVRRMDAEPPVTTRQRPPGRARALRVAAAALVGVGLAAAVDRPREVRSDVERVFVFDGRGFGHGVGMSQWGARGAALQGLDAARILAHYYRGTTIERRAGENVRVLIVDEVADVRITSPRGLVVAPEGGGFQLPRTTRNLVLRATDGRITADDGNGTTVRADWTAVRFGSTAPVRVNGADYRGTIRVSTTPAGLRVVNTLPLEEYLRSVVSKEMSPAWGDDAPQALRAQAIAARTYALATRVTGRDFDLYDDQRSQVYGGVAAEDPRTDTAVRATAGQVLTADGEPIVAYYSASSGGRTEEGDRVFPAKRPQPWLASVDDPYDAVAPLHDWADLPTFGERELRERFGTVIPIDRVEILERGSSPRVMRARVTTLPFGSFDLTGPQLRAVLELPDTWVDVVERERAPGGAPVAVAADAPREDVWMAVLNGTGRAGAAGAVARRAEEAGYRAVFAGNAPAHDGRARVYYTPGAEEAARRAAADLGIPQMEPIAQAVSSHVAEAAAGTQVVVVLAR